MWFFVVSGLDICKNSSAKVNSSLARAITSFEASRFEVKF